MKTSVIIPAYNAANTIERAIESCLQQSLPASEIIVIDDASTDNTCEIVSKYKEVTLLNQTTNQGPSAARNKGWDAASGDIIAFLDSDDTWHKDKLKIITEIFTDYGHIQYLGHTYSTSNDSSIDISTLKVRPVNYWSIIAQNPYQPSCIAVRRALPERFDESYRYCEDHELSIRIAHKYAAHLFNLPLTILGRPQLSIGGASSNKWKMRKGELRLYSSIYKHNPLYIITIPFLWIWSLGKMAYRALFK